MLLRLCAFSTALAIWMCSSLLHAQDHSPQLLLTPKRLKRLQRDRERQTERWLNFQNRLNSIADSPERGFELALYYAATREENFGRQAIDWARTHKCATRQIALILDWCASLLSPSDRQDLASGNCPFTQMQNETRIERVRDALFMQIASGDDSGNIFSGKQLEQFGLADPRTLYAACEYIEAIRETKHLDLREDDAPFFRTLPAEFLLSMKPQELDHPAWEASAAALALVSLDPNLEGSQFLQGWAMEDRQMIRKGPGVAYELLWGDPYLPGVSYQNLDPWFYASGHLFARTDWDPNSCWISASIHGVEEVNCPSGWRQHSQTFGRMTLIPMTQPCIEVPHVKERQAAIIWRLQPHEKVLYVNEKKHVSSQADEAGLWLLPGYIEGKICTPATQQ